MKSPKGLLRSYRSSEVAAPDSLAEPGRLPEDDTSTPLRCAEFEADNLGLISVDGAGQIIDANHAFWAMTGYSPQDLPLHINAITPIEWQIVDDSKVRQLADSGHCLPWQKQILNRHGQRFTILTGVLELCPVFDGVRYFVANIERHVLAEAAVRDYQSALTRTSVELSLSAERERREIAEELHDSVGQELALAKLRLSKLREETGGAMRSELDAVAVQISNALVSCRTLSHALAVPALYELGLIPALKNLFAMLNKDDRPRLTVFFADEDLPVRETARIIVYRVIRELLINVVKHAQADNVNIAVTGERDKLKVVITDDGIGFDTRISHLDVSADYGFGLFLVRERLRHIGGSFELESTIGRGTRVTVMAPLDDTMSSAGPAA